MSTDANASPGFLRRTVRGAEDSVANLGALTIDLVGGLGAVSVFALRAMSWLVTRLPKRGTIIPNFYQIGVLTLPVVALTGTFIGMVLAAQAAFQFQALNLETRLGAVINLSLLRELGPVLAATMLAGRVGSAIAAELGTMRVTEQIDALSSMGVDPVHYLVVPRFLACLLLIPCLTLVADFMGVVGGYWFCVVRMGIDEHHYFENSREVIGIFDIFVGVFKSFFFGGAISIIACYRGFYCEPGAEGVGRAATGSFVLSFVVILLLDFFLGLGLDTIYMAIWPEGKSLIGG